MSAPIAVRLVAAVEADADYFASIELESDTREYILPNTASEHRRGIHDSGLVYLRIEVDLKAVGFVILALDPDGESVEFRRIVVSEKGRGIGQAALRSLEEFCLGELGRTRIWLDVFERNQRGRHVYQKFGYRVVENRRGEHGGEALLYYDKHLGKDHDQGDIVDAIQ